MSDSKPGPKNPGLPGSGTSGVGSTEGGVGCKAGSAVKKGKSNQPSEHR